jgi:hypothetical protein
METRVYRYRRAATVALPAFFTFWSLGCWIGVLAKGPYGPITVNGRPGTPEEALRFFLFGLLAATLVGSLSLRLILGWTNERIEICDAELRWIDWLGRERVELDLSEVRALRFGNTLFVREGYGFWRPWGNPYAQSLERMSIVTDRGDVPVGGTITDYDELKGRLQSAWLQNVSR